MKKTLLKVLIGTLIAFASIAITFVLFQTNFVQNTFGSDFFTALDRKASDALMRMRGVRPHTSNVVIVRIDENTLKELDYPLPRDKFGALLAIISECKPKAIGVDYLFPTAGQDSLSQAQSQYLVQYAGLANNVIHAIGPFIPSGEQLELKARDIDPEAKASLHRFAIPGTQSGVQFPRATYIDERPFDSLAVLAAGIGHVLLIPDSVDGVIRKVPLLIEYAGDYYPAFGAALAFHAAGIDLRNVKVVKLEDRTEVHAGSFVIPVDEKGELGIDFAGPNRIFQEISFYDVLEAYTKNDVKTLAMFKDAVVIIGPTARSIGDHGATPLSDKSPNCYVHANVYDQIVSEKYIHVASPGLQIGLLIFLTLIVANASLLLKLRWSMPIGVLLLGGYLWFAYNAFANTGEVYSLTAPLFALFFSYAGTISYVSATEGKQKSQIKNMFQKYVDASVVEQLIDNPSMLKLGGEEREITTLFADIEGFTRMAEKLGPQNTVGILNSYLTEMTNVIIEEHGTLDKYIGDAIMAFWNAPLDNPDHALHACTAALRMQKKLTGLHAKWVRFGKPMVNQRIGVNTGKAVVGNMGAEAKFNYTAVGDAVNLASRLEGVNKEYGTRLLMSGNTQKLVEGKILSREMDLVVVLGRTEPVRIYELIAMTDEVQTDATKRFLDLYHQGLESYKQRAWKSAIDYFQQGLQIRKDDVVSNLYIQRAMLYSDVPPPEDWNGVFVMTKK
ncbi:MAG: adenylate/guanylate cyclase domain-containing protein [Ignavibacteriales bacterium]|nr:adenylate/guanylate cyclase domain-containing protein [Ignavibacteriales bacterium]